MSENNHSELINHAKICYKLERWEDTVECLKNVLKMDTLLNYEERQLLLRALWRKPKYLIQTWRSLQNDSKGNILVNNLIEKVEQEIAVHCDNVIKFLDDDLIIKDKNVDAIVDYKCHKADQYNYKIISMYGKDKDDDIRKCRELFKEAMTIARESLKASHPVRVYTAEQLYHFQKNFPTSDKHLKEAHVIARQAYNEGISGLSDLDSSLHKDATIYLKRLRALIDNKFS